ncbi:MAG: hypothetical protein GY839_12400 [candidate division Zixibacteria bacterium]|nr:hypothetical protein [candidate division Zixibacteria bacterium]
MIIKRHNRKAYIGRDPIISWFAADARGNLLDFDVKSRKEITQSLIEMGFRPENINNQ